MDLNNKYCSWFFFGCHIFYLGCPLNAIAWGSLNKAHTSRTPAEMPSGEHLVWPGPGEQRRNYIRYIHLGGSRATQLIQKVTPGRWRRPGHLPGCSKSRADRARRLWQRAQVHQQGKLLPQRSPHHTPFNSPCDTSMDERWFKGKGCKNLTSWPWVPDGCS